MRKFLGGALVLSLCAAVAFAGPRPDHGNHGGDEHHDNGRHLGWDKHHDDEDRAEHRGWDYRRDSIDHGREYPHGHYEGVRRTWVLGAFDFHTRRVVLGDHSHWVIASYDIDRCRDWRWGHDDVRVYEDDVHPGWYVLFNARLGHYVHVQYFGN
jgi:hypothetical protein